MKYLIFLIMFLETTIGFSQSLCHTDILNAEKVLKINQLNDFKKYDFSDLWLKTDSQNMYGIIGNDYQRLHIKFISVVKNEYNPTEYLVYGKTSVKENVCEFLGKITISKIQETKREFFGVDNEFKNKGIRTQGILIATYEFFENKTQNHTGVFSGELQSKWYLDQNDHIKYDDINFSSDGYFNNAFVGNWKMYNSSLVKICNWGDYRVPYVKCDFDIGAGEFSVSEKYIQKGWLSEKLENRLPNEAIKREKGKNKTTEWWQ